MARALDLKGKTINYLTAIARVPSRGGAGVVWRFRCICGKEVTVKASVVNIGRTKSCGCKKSELLTQAFRFPGYEAEYNDAYRIHLRNAKKRDITSQLSRDDFVKIAKRPCRYCGTAFSLRVFACGYNREYPLNSVDRLNNEPFYSLRNSVPSCLRCQEMKRCSTEKDFLNHVDRIKAYTAARRTT